MDALARRRRSALWLLGGGAIGWALVIPAAALTIGQPAARPVVRAAAALPYAVGWLICHQQARRSFALWSQQLPVCARCTGIYVGAALVALAFGARAFEASRSRSRSPEKPVRQLSPARVAFLAALPSVATLVYELTSGTVPSNVTRAIAGLPLGAAVEWAILSVIGDQVN